MAAALLRHALAAQPEPLRSVPVISAGVAARRGDPATEYSAIALKKVGITLASHQSQPVTQELLDKSLLVLCMTESHRTMIQLTGEPPPERLLLFRELLDDRMREIADPYGSPLPVYESSRDEMVEAIPSIVEYLRRLVS